MKIAITGGHITPALAVIEELQARKLNIEIVYFGRKYSFEGDKTLSNDYEIVSKLSGITYYNLETGRLQRRFSLKTIISLLRIPKGLYQAYKDLKQEKPEVVLSFGGYLAVPVVLSSALLKIPVITHEQTVVIGLSNRIISWFAKKILVTWEKSLKYFPQEKTTVVGNPVRKDIFTTDKKTIKNLPPKLKAILKSKLDNPNKKLIYVTGGNQGSQTINHVVWDLLPELLKDYSVVHQCGRKDWTAVEKGKIKIPEDDNYYVAPWIDEKQIGLVFNIADIIVSRAGANTVYEVACLAKPTIFIPIPWVVNNEQQKNAELLSNAGLASIVSENNLKPWKLKKRIDEMFDKLLTYQEKGLELQASMKTDAAALIVDEVLSLTAKNSSQK